MAAGLAATAAVPDMPGWRRQDQNGGVAYFSPANDALVVVAPPKEFGGSMRSAYEKALGGFLGGKIVEGGSVQEMGPDVYFSEYQVQEANGSRTWRASVALQRDGRFQSALYAANDEPSYRKYRPQALAFFGVFRGDDTPPPAASSSAAVVGEWYTGRISTIQYENKTTGMLAPPSGNNMTYRIKPDGTYEQSGLMQFNYGACTNSYFMNITGRWELNGDLLRLTPTDGTFDSRTCGGQPKRQPTNKVVSEVRVRITGNELVMTDKEGKSSTYRRQR